MKVLDIIDLVFGLYPVRKGRGGLKCRRQWWFPSENIKWLQNNNYTSVLANAITSGVRKVSDA